MLYVVIRLKGVVTFMKRLTSVLLVLAMLLTFMPAVYAEGGSDFEISGNTLVRYNGTGTSVTVPAEVEIIGSGAFQNNKTLISVRFAGKVKSIQSQAFAGCEKLTFVSFADVSALESIGSKAFAGCAKLNPSWASKVESVAGNAFEGCNTGVQGVISNNKADIPTPTPVPTPTPAPVVTPDPVDPEVPVEPEEPSISVETKDAIEIIVQPEDQVVAVGATATFAVEAIGDGLTYQWKYKTATGTVWQTCSLSGNKTAKMSFKATSARMGNSYICVITDANGNTVESNPAKLIDESTATLEIVTQPTDQIVALDATAVFAVEANGIGLTYQWEYKTSASWMVCSLTGNKTAKLSVKAIESRMGNYYRCVITDENGNTVTSDEVQLLNIAEIPSTNITIVEQPVERVVASGTTTSFSVVAEGEGLTYQWQYRTPTATKWYTCTLTGNTTSKLTVKAISTRFGNYYRCVITDSEGFSLATDAVRLLEEGVEVPEIKLEITEQPTEQVVELNAKAIFKVVAEGDGMTFKWQYKTATGTKWIDSSLSNSKYATFSIKAISSRMGYSYRCVITDIHGNQVISDAVKLLEDVPYVEIDGVQYEITGNTAEIIGYVGTATNLTIPETVNDATVIRVGEAAFEGNTTLTSIDLPDSITTIGRRAFANCTKLAEIK